jgi:Niemann-Pick C1 protein
MDNVDPTVAIEYLKALKDQQKVTSEQLINQNGGDLAFFTFDVNYLQWEFLLIILDELVKLSAIGIITVSTMTVLFMPHWTGVMFVAPLVIVLYVDLMGILQFLGIYINSGKKGKISCLLCYFQVLMLS